MEYTSTSNCEELCSLLPFKEIMGSMPKKDLEIVKIKLGSEKYKILQAQTGDKLTIKSSYSLMPKLGLDVSSTKGNSDGLSSELDSEDENLLTSKDSESEFLEKSTSRSDTNSDTELSNEPEPGSSTSSSFNKK